MIITPHGEGYFKIQSGGFVVVVDPLDQRVKTDIILKTKTAMPLSQISQDSVIGAGEYELQGIEIKGVQNNSADAKLVETIYKVKAEGVSLVFLGNPSKLPDTEIREKLGEVDIIFAPSGSAKLVKQLEPKIIVPVFFKNLKEAEKEFDQKITLQEKLTIKKKDLTDKLQIIALKI